MIHRLANWILNRPRIAPPLQSGTRCCVPGCNRQAGEQWWPGFCSLREAGVYLGWTATCDKHDVELNEMQVRFLFGDQYEAELSAYRARRLGTTEEAVTHPTPAELAREPT